jgi:hypothetical protein
MGWVGIRSGISAMVVRRIGALGLARYGAEGTLLYN